MKKIYSLLLLFCFCIGLFSCQSEEEIGTEVGYLSLSVGQDISTNESRAVPSNYNPKQIAVQILNAKNTVVKTTDDWTEWKNQLIELPVGKYTIKASSAGFDGNDAAFEIPYYAASKEIEIKSGKNLSETLTCLLANVKVTVQYDPAFVAAFKKVSAKVGDIAGTFQPLTFVTTETRSAYFPVTNLYATVEVVNNAGIWHELKKEFTEVKARDHYILKYRLADTGNGNVTVVVDPKTNTYEYTFTLGANTKSAKLSANAWSTFATLTASSVSGITEGQTVSFEYRAQGTEEWSSLTATSGDGKYTAQVTGLAPGKTYEYQLVSEGATIGSVASFTTETQVALQNGGFEDWYQDGKIWYAASKETYNASNYMWDTSNPGGGAFGFNPTTSDATVKHSGNSSAKLESQYAVVKFAAASLYYGRFGKLIGMTGAVINFGQPFTSRPTALHGYYQYAPKAIDYVGDKQPAGTVKKGDMDICAIYIALAKKQYSVDNTNPETFIDFNNNENIIAYGELPASDCVATGDVWKEFTINLKYKSMTEKPTHLIIVCSSSKYGDYFTGGKGSVLRLDDFNLVYGDTPSAW